MKRFLTAALLLSFAVSASATVNVYQAGVSGGRWLDLPFSTRASALAGLGATGQGVDALSYNPAGLAGAQEFQAVLAQDYWLTDASSQRLGLALPWGPGGWGVAFDNVDFGAVNQYSVNSLGQVSAQGSVNPDAWALQTGYGLNLGSFSVGAAVQGLNQNLGGRQQVGYDLDLGGGFHEGPLSLGVGLMGAAGELGGEDLPRGLDLEGDFRAWEGGAASLDVLAGADWQMSDDQATGALALEARLTRYLTLRGGYRAAGSNAAGGWALGFGFRPLSWLGLDYAYNAVGSLQATNQWTLDLFWGGRSRRAVAESGPVGAPAPFPGRSTATPTPAPAAVAPPSPAGTASPSPTPVAPPSRPPLPVPAPVRVAPPPQLPAVAYFRRRATLLPALSDSEGAASTGRGVPALEAGLNGPIGIAVDPAGNVFIADEYNQRVLEASTDGAVRTVAGGGAIGVAANGTPARTADLAFPSGVAVDASGNVFIADTSNHRVVKVDASGRLWVVADEGEGLKFPVGLALDGRGDLFIADVSGQRVFELEPSGRVRPVAGTDATGYSGDGGPALSAELDGPTGVAVDGRGDLYIADSGNHRVRETDPAGTIRTVAGDGRRGYSGDGAAAVSARLNQPFGVAVDGQGDLYIADSGNHRVREVDPAGTIRTVAGTGQVGYFGDGRSAKSIRLSFPSDVACGPDGRVYIADYGNQLVRALK